MTQILYISYDGLTDPLGQSQVIPYLKALSQKGFAYSILSFEKQNAFSEREKAIRGELATADITWHPMAYTKRPPIFSTLYDLWRMKRKAQQIVKKDNIQLIHARSYLPAVVGLSLMNNDNLKPATFNFQLIFDMRGFWADERVDGGLWNLNNPLYKWIYKFFKKQERKLLNKSDHIISLTNAGKAIIQQRSDLLNQPVPVTVIPTCVDTERFDPGKIDPVITEKIQSDLGRDRDTFVLGYVGSTGTWYLLEEMLAFFKILSEKRNSVFFFVTKDAPETILQKANRHGIGADKLIIRPANYEDVPNIIAVFNAGIFFIKPVFSKKASSPTKMGEILAMGKPVICNDIGDTSEIVRESKCGFVIDDFKESSYQAAIEKMDELKSIDPTNIRQTAKQYFSLKDGVRKYEEVYKKLTFHPPH